MTPRRPRVTLSAHTYGVITTEPPMPWTRHPSGGPGQGDGWGGPAKGSLPAGPRVPITGREQWSDEQKAKAAARKAKAEARAEEMREKIYELATTAERQETQLAAAQAYLNRVEGMPVARNLNAEADKETVRRVINGEPISAAEWEAKYGDEAQGAAPNTPPNSAQAH